MGAEDDVFTYKIEGYIIKGANNPKQATEAKIYNMGKYQYGHVLKKSSFKNEHNCPVRWRMREAGNLLMILLSLWLPI